MEEKGLYGIGKREAERVLDKLIKLSEVYESEYGSAGKKEFQAGILSALSKYDYLIKNGRVESSTDSKKIK